MAHTPANNPEPSLVLTREAIAAGALQAIAGSIPGLSPLSAEELEKTRLALLASRPTGGDLWLFAYGSLLWNPAFSFDRQEIAHLKGWHRRLCLWSKFARGTPQAPGLVFGLEPGGACRGLVYRLPADNAAAELDIIWRREMVSGAYRARWVRVATPIGPQTALAFTTNRAHASYTGTLSAQTIVAAVRGGHGVVGPCLDYVRNTAEALDRLAIPDRRLNDLLQAIDRPCANGAVVSDTPHDRRKSIRHHRLDPGPSARLHHRGRTAMASSHGWA